MRARALSLIFVIAAFAALSVAGAGSGAAASGSLTLLHSFVGADGKIPRSGLLFDTNGVIYGATQRGGASNLGTLFALAPPAAPGGAWTQTVLHNFSGGADGASPDGNLVFDSFGALYGTTVSGGASAAGAIYQVSPPATPGGVWSEAVLYQFAGGVDGAFPSSGLVFDSFGALYGVTRMGGANGAGTLYSLTPPTTPGGSWTKTTLFSFHNVVNGGAPTGSLIFDTSGALYGALAVGAGAHGFGAVFKLTPPPSPGGNWTQTILHQFGGASDGAGPVGNLFFDTNGALYGATAKGGAFGAGVIFQLTPPAVVGNAWTELVLYAFSGGADGGSPAAPFQDTTGALYGVTQSGGAANLGAVFKLTPPAVPGGPWAGSSLHDFTGADGAEPQSSLAFDGSGSVYGVTAADGARKSGTVFQLAP